MLDCIPGGILYQFPPLLLAIFWTICLDATPAELLVPTSIIPPFSLNALSAAALPIYPGLG